MKDKIAILISVLALIIAIAALGAQAPAEKQSSLEKMRTTGKMDVCYVVYPPTVIKDPLTENLSGHMIDTVNAILEPINVKPEFHEQAWGTAALGLQSGVCDLVAAGYFINIPRANAVAFTKPLFYIGDAALVKKGDSRFSSIMDADKKGIAVAVATGESGHEFVKQNFRNAEIRVIDVEGGDLFRLYLEVLSGRADIAVTDAWNVKMFADVHPDTEALFLDKPFNLNPVAWAVRQDDTEFMRFIENSLETLEINGKLNEFEKKYDAHWLHEAKTYRIE